MYSWLDSRLDNQRKIAYLVLSDWAPNEDDYSLPLVFVLSMLQGQLRYLHRAGQVCLPFNIQVLQHRGTVHHP